MKEEINFSTNQSSNQPTYVPSKRNKKIGLLWLLGPTVSIVIILFLFALTNTILGSTEGSPLIATIINFVLGFLGLIAAIAVPVGIVMGIIYLGKKEIAKGAKFDDRSGKGDASTIPSEIQK